MSAARPLILAVGLILSGLPAFAQDLSRYRAYVLESSLAAVVAASGTRLADARTLHQRPAAIQQLEWRAPYVDSRTALADPVRGISFTFYNGALYQLIVSYERDRTQGMTDGDLVESLSAAYGPATLPSATPLAGGQKEALPDKLVIARWETAAAMLTLLRGSYAPDVQLVLVSKPLSARAAVAVLEATRQDALDAPQREADRREKAADDASTARAKAREANKAAFRP